MLTLNDLERVAPGLLPHRSATVRAIDWESLQAALGATLPTDYREFAGRYPSLCLDESMILRVPDPGDESRFVSGTFSLGEEFADLAEDGMTEDYVFHPALGGLICWGGTDTGTVSSGERTARTPTSGRRSSPRVSATGGNTRAAFWR
jgi:hypothetical protein